MGRQRRGPLEIFESRQEVSRVGLRVSIADIMDCRAPRRERIGFVEEKHAIAVAREWAAGLDSQGGYTDRKLGNRLEPGDRLGEPHPL